MDHYNTLGIARNASQDEIKQAYRKLASVHHPDKGGDTAKFQQIQQAYETLSNPQKKQEYDNPFRNQRQGFPGQGGFGMHGFPGGGFTFTTGAGGINIDDIFGQMFGHRQHQTTYKTTVWVTLEQVLNGGEQILHFQTPDGNQVVKIDIPKGVDNGMQMRYENILPEAILIVEFRVHQHHKFNRDGLDLYAEHEISVLDLIVGTEFEFETLSGKKLQVSVKAYSQPNTNLRIPNQGLTKDYRTGDQYVLLKPVMPANIDSEVVEAILRTKNKGY
jgi:DnaJ-class molecular chaperone